MTKIKRLKSENDNLKKFIGVLANALIFLDRALIISEMKTKRGKKK
jgi:hypothetical protein